MSAKVSEVEAGGVNDLTQVVRWIAMNQKNVEVEEHGRYNTKVSGRCAHYIRDAVEDDHRLKVRRDINQYAFIVDWNA